MYRSAAKRLLRISSLYQNELSKISTIRTLTLNSHRFSTSAPSDPLPTQISNQFDASSPSTATDDVRDRSYESQTSRGTGPTVHYEDEQVRVLSASLRHVFGLGWTEAAMIAGAREVGVSPSIVGSFPRKEASLVEFFMDECLQKLIDIVESGDDLKNLVPSDRVIKIVKARLELQAPYIQKWPQALSIQAQPVNVPTSFKQRAVLVDEIWHAAGDDASDVDWYVKRTILAGIYSTTEIYMLTDNSPEFRDTWAFLEGRVKDAFDLKKAFQEAKYLAEAVGAGMGSSFQGFTKIFQH
jgi:ubiquinone biosynthesis protein COQ9